jgi:hypothetical protein
MLSFFNMTEFRPALYGPDRLVLEGPFAAVDIRNNEFDKDACSLLSHQVLNF